MKIFIDDERYMPEGYDVLARTERQAIDALTKAKEDGRVHLQLVSFDYDAHSHLPWTFENVAQWMVDNDVWPDEIRIHTFNWWGGRPWLLKFFKKHAPKTTIIDETNPWDDATRDDPDAPCWVREFVEAQNR